MSVAGRPAILPREAGEGDHAKHGGGGLRPIRIVPTRRGPLHRADARSPSPASRVRRGRQAPALILSASAIAAAGLRSLKPLIT